MGSACVCKVLIIVVHTVYKRTWNFYVSDGSYGIQEDGFVLQGKQDFGASAGDLVSYSGFGESLGKDNII